MFPAIEKAFFEEKTHWQALQYYGLPPEILYLPAFRLENYLFSVYVFEEKPRIGTFGISIPGTSIVPASTLYITGSKNENFVRMMGERLAIQLQKLVLISLSLEEIENELLLKIMHKIEANLPKQKKRESK